MGADPFCWTDISVSDSVVDPPALSPLAQNNGAIVQRASLFGNGGSTRSVTGIDT